MNATLPSIDWPAWRDTALHLQLMTQIVGKVRLSLTPWLNHGWHVSLYVTPNGLTSSAIPYAGASFEIAFDLEAARLDIVCSTGATAGFALEPGTIAGFYARIMEALASLGVEISIVTLPNEMPEPVRFPDDQLMRPFDADAARRFHGALRFADTVFKQFRTAFLGKCSPVHFFWGSFDLAVTRFSGRRAPIHPGGVPGLPDAVTREAYSHEVSSAGFWPGSDAYPRAAFYSYAYPAPAGFADALVLPDAARFDAALGEFLLDYDDLRGLPDPEAALLNFLQSTYEAAAEHGNWARGDLECGFGVPRIPRRV